MGSNCADSRDPKHLWAATEDDVAFSTVAQFQLEKRKVFSSGPEDNAGELLIIQSGTRKVQEAVQTCSLSYSKAAKIQGRRTKKKSMEDILQLCLSKREESVRDSQIQNRNRILRDHVHRCETAKDEMVEAPVHLSFWLVVCVDPFWASARTFSTSSSPLDFLLGTVGGGGEMLPEALGSACFFDRDEWFSLLCDTLPRVVTRVVYLDCAINWPNSYGYPTLELKCEENTITTIQISGVDYRVLVINSDGQILRIVRENLMERICSQTFTNTSMDSTLFDVVEDGKSLTIYYGCSSYIPGMGGSIVMDMVFITPLFMSRQTVGSGGCEATSPTTLAIHQ
ncbi:hypothetical protein Ancab_034779, partial [Ancistrocladus abbreviatus]